MKKRGYLALGLFLLCAVGLVWLLGVETVPQTEPLFLPPEEDSAPGREDLLSCVGPLELRYTLPAWEGALRPVLEIWGLDAAAALRLDGEPLGQFPAGLGRVYLTLPEGFAGKTLTLSMEKGETDAVPFLYLTDARALGEQYRADTSLHAFPAAVFGMAFLLTIGLFLYGWVEGARLWPVLLLAAAALGQTAYFYLENFPASTLPPALFGLVMYQSRALLFAAPPLYLLLRMRKRRRLFAPFALLPALVYEVVAGFQTVVPAFANVAARVGGLFCFTAAALVACAVLEFRDGNPAFRLVLPGGGVAAAVGLAAAALASPATLRMFLEDPLVWIEIELFCWSTLLLALCFWEGAAAYLRFRAGQEAEWRVLAARESLTREQLAAVRESAAALGSLRHEVKNHYLVLQSLLRAGEGERLDAYLGSLVEEASAIPALSCAAHPAIDAVLTVMLARARKQGVEVERRADVPEALPFPDAALCTVLANLLQNALDANALAPEGARKWLRVDLHVRGVHLYIGVENARFAPVEYDRETGLCRTTRADPSAHGYGLKAVRAVARKYRSELLLDFPEGAFSAALTLQMPDE